MNKELEISYAYKAYRESEILGIEYEEAQQISLRVLHELLYDQRSEGHGLSQRFVNK